MPEVCKMNPNNQICFQIRATKKRLLRFTRNDEAATLEEHTERNFYIELLGLYQTTSLT